MSLTRLLPWCLLILLPLLLWLSLTPAQRLRLQHQLQVQLAGQAPARPVTVPQPAAEVEAVWPDQAWHAPMVCTPRQAAVPSAPGVWRWRDAQGRIHFSDRPPGEAVVAEDLSARFAPPVPRVQVHFEAPPAVLSAALQGQLHDDAARMMRFYARYLPATALHPVNLHVRAFTEASAFADWQRQYSPEDSRLAGLYDPLSARIGVHLPSTAAAARGLLRHEMAHGIAHALLARPPTWFDEGMAEVFRLLRHEPGQGPWAPAAEHYRQQLLALPAEAVFVYLDTPVWPGADPPLAYAAVWSLAAFLVSHGDGDLLSSWLQYLHAQYCQPVDSRAFFARHYPGGLAGWQQDWQRWLSRPLADGVWGW